MVSFLSVPRHAADSNTRDVAHRVEAEQQAGGVAARSAGSVDAGVLIFPRATYVCSRQAILGADWRTRPAPSNPVRPGYV
jgi:hypothetical protein